MAAALQGRILRVRTRLPGDRIQPLGMAGSKSIQDLFVDAKVPVAQREQLPLLLADDRAKPALSGLRTEKLVNAIRLADVRQEIFGDDTLTRGRVTYPEQMHIDETTFSLG